MDRPAARGLMPNNANMSSYFAWPRRRPNDPSTRKMNTIAGHANCRGISSSGADRRIAMMSPRMTPTTPPASSAAGRRANSVSMPRTAWSVSRPSTPPRTYPEAAPRKTYRSAAPPVDPVASVPS